MTDPAPAAALGSGAMFDGIAPRYDLLNRLLSLGVDQRWRRATVASLGLRPGDEVLDVATGTADLAMRLAAGDGLRVVGLDPSRGMLDVGRAKLGAAGLADRVELVEGDAMQLPFESGRFAGATMAFGIRNVPDRPRALRELRRVCRPGAKVAILELSEPRSGFFGPLARFHVHHVVPALGALLSGSREYRYLQRSIAAFPSPEAFADVIVQSGLAIREVRPMTFGVVCLYVAEVPGERSAGT